MSISDTYIEIIVLYSIIFIICVIGCIKFCCWCKSDNDNIEIPTPVLPLSTIHEVVELTEVIQEKVELQIIDIEEEEEEKGEKEEEEEGEKEEIEI